MRQISSHQMRMVVTVSARFAFFPSGANGGHAIQVQDRFHGQLGTRPHSGPPPPRGSRARQSTTLQSVAPTPPPPQSAKRQWRCDVTRPGRLLTCLERPGATLISVQPIDEPSITPELIRSRADAVLLLLGAGV